MEANKGKILIVDDDIELSEVIKDMLTSYGYEVFLAKNIEEAYDLLTKRKYKLIILDINLPDGSGFDICTELRRVSEVPVIFASARSSEDDKISSLDMGGDDYLAKPYSLRELMSRINALMRRTYGNALSEKVYEIGENILIDQAKRLVTKDGVEIKMALKEFDLLCYMAKNANKALSKDDLLSSVWGAFSETEISTVSVHIRWLREKLEKDPANPKILITVWGHGYELVNNKEHANEKKNN